MLADNTRCSRKLPNGCTCDGSYTQCSIVEKGVGGALKGTIVCNKYNFVLNYGDEDINTTTPKPFTGNNNIGRRLMFSFILNGRPLYGQYQQICGVFGINFFSQKTCQRGIQEVVKTLEKQLDVEVSFCGSKQYVVIYTSVCRTYLVCILHM